MNENYNTPNSGCCGRPMNYNTTPKCNYNNCCMNEYHYKQKACIRNKQPDCETQAVIPSITVETADGITNLANCLVHVNDINTTFYVDDKHRIMITWAGPVNIPGYDMEGNPNHYKNQIVTDTEAETAVIYDNHGKGYIFGITPENLQQVINDKLDEMAADGTLQEMVIEYIQSIVYGFDTVADMKASTELKVGDFAKTAGYYSANDGGGSYFKVRAKEVSDVNDDATVIVFGDLTAEIVTDGTISYDQFGAKGDGITDDFDKLRATHEYANANKLEVIANAEKTYYVKDITTEIPVKTNADWKGAKFIIDDSGTPANNWLFSIPNSEQIDVTSQITQTLNGESVDCGVTGHGLCLVRIQNSNKRDFIRTGGNADSGSYRTEHFMCNNEGKILNPLQFDFTNVTSATAYPVDKGNITIKNGVFETIVNTIDSYNYINRGIRISRSNVIVDNLTHTVVGENDATTSSPYNGFIYTYLNYNVAIKNCAFSAHKTFYEGSASKGSYDLNNNGTINLHYENIQQTNSITDTALWGIHGSNYCKDVTFEGCRINRIDAHKGVTNLTIKNCTLGKDRINVVGFGKLYVENTTALGYSLISLRNDFGGFWKGDLVIRSCKIINDYTGLSHILFVINEQNHDYGYKCYLPNIDVDGLFVNNSNSDSPKIGILGGTVPTSLPDFTKTYEENAASNVYPLIYPEKVTVKNVRAVNGSYLVYNPYNDPHACYFEKIGHADTTDRRGTNFNKQFNHYLTIENCDLSTEALTDDAYNVNRNSVFDYRNVAGVAENTTHRGVILVKIRGCDYLYLSNQGRFCTYDVKNCSIYQMNSGYTYNYGSFIFDMCEFHTKYADGQTNKNFTIAAGSSMIRNSTFIRDENNDTLFYTEDILTPHYMSGNHAVVRYISLGNNFNLTDAEFDNISDFNNYKNRMLWTIERFTATTAFGNINNYVGTDVQKPDDNLMAGMSYYNTTSNTMQVYNGTTWVNY